MDNKPSVLFWTSLAQAFETQAKEAVRCEADLNFLNWIKVLKRSIESHSFHIHPNYSQHWLSEITPIVSRVLLKDCRSHRYSLLSLASKVSSSLSLDTIPADRHVVVVPKRFSFYAPSNLSKRST